ncbi:MULTISPECIES: hypothetical protein [Corynebacterium]|uniref:hypothetical protein n=1 Tax=Corynebacterium TaxID=1716 RepID=UPI00124D7B8B|nr:MULTISPECIES: hypothetical protein [Corynebacterium]
MTLSGTGQKAGPTGDSVAEAVTELRATSTSEGDAWLDQPEPAERRFADVTRELVDVPLLQLRRFIRFVGTPPGLMTLMCVILSVALLAAGLSIARSSEDQERDLNQLLDHVEPMSYSALNLYTSLSIADTSATTGFVENRAGSPRVRERYNDAISQASIAAAQTMGEVRDSNSEEMRLLAAINQKLPVYTGLIETARANYNMGNPVGTAYLAEASSLMRSEILPNASRLYELTSATVAEQQQDLTRPQWVPISGLVAAFVLLVLAQAWLYNRTRRILNRGFAAATVLMLAALLWVGSANWATWNAGQQGFNKAAGPMSELTNARIAAQQARTKETLALVRRQSVADNATLFYASMDRIDNAIDSYRSSPLLDSAQDQMATNRAEQSVEQWRVYHERLRDAQSSGNYDTALDVTLGNHPRSAATAFDELDANLSTLISDARATMRDYIADGLRATRLLAIMVSICSVLSVVLVWIGIRPRLLEFL